MGSPNWQMALQMTISSIGMFLVLRLGGVMAERRKMQFMILPSFLSAAVCLGMALTSDVLVFLILSGLGALFENIASPAITAIVRANYPPTHRGTATGSIRAWCSVAFLLTCVSSAWLLDHASSCVIPMIRAQLVVSGVVSAIGTIVFWTIRERAAPSSEIATFGSSSSPYVHQCRALAGRSLALHLQNLLNDRLPDFCHARRRNPIAAGGRQPVCHCTFRPLEDLFLGPRVVERN